MAIIRLVFGKRVGGTGGGWWACFARVASGSAIVFRVRGLGSTGNSIAMPLWMQTFRHFATQSSQGRVTRCTSQIDEKQKMDFPENGKRCCFFRRKTLETPLQNQLFAFASAPMEVFDVGHVK